MIRRIAAVAGAAWLLVAVAPPVVAGANAPSSTRPHRVLLISLPGVTWEDIARVKPPALDHLFAGSAIADLATRAAGRPTRLGDGYLSLGAGGRIFGDSSTVGESFQVGEPFGSGTAGDAFEQRTNRRVQNGIVSLDIVSLRTDTRSQPYDAQLGALGNTLADAGYRRAVIANGDGSLPDTQGLGSTTLFERSAALGLMSGDGLLPGGRVDTGLLEPAPAAPYGVELNHRAVLQAFDREWKDHSVVLVEASDLVRAARYEPFVSSSQRARIFDRALLRSDTLVRDLLDRVDPSLDAVIVVGPAPRTDVATLTVASLRAAGTNAGLLRSGTTRRTGFVQLMDVAPTVLHLLGIDPPGKMEGRAFGVGDDLGTFAERRGKLADADAAAQFRDRRVAEVQGALIGFAALTVLFAVLALLYPSRSRFCAAARSFALAGLAFVAATFLARFVSLHTAGVGSYWAFLLGLTAALTVVYRRVGRRHVLDPLLIALLVLTGLLLVDTMLGTPLQFSSALGPSPTSSRRFGGLTNTSYAALAAAALVAATLLPQRFGARLGTRLGIGLLVVVVVVDGLPFWGADIGGILSLVPAFGITTALMLGKKIRWRHVAAAVGLLAVALAAFTAIDLSHASGDRSHLGRLVERVQADGFGDFVIVVERKLLSNLRTLSSSLLGVLLPVVLGFLVWIWVSRRNDVHVLARRFPTWRATCIAFALLASLGWALNDSGIAIPGIMLLVFNAAFVWLLLSTAPEPATRSAPRAKAKAMATR